MENLQKVFMFLHEIASVEMDELDIDSKLEIDLGISGEDAYYVISSFATRFNVDISEFKIEDYFFDEPNFFSLRTKSKKNELTVKDLILAVDSKVLK